MNALQLMDRAGRKVLLSITILITLTTSAFAQTSNESSSNMEFGAVPTVTNDATNRMAFYVQVDSVSARYQPALERIMRTSASALDDMLVAQNALVVDSQLAGGETIEELLRQAADNQQQLVALLDVRQTKDGWFGTSYQAELTVYQVRTGARTLYWQKEYEKVNQFQTFMARLSYDLPLQMQLQSQQVAKVINVNGREVQLDFDSGSGLQRGDMLRVFKEGDEIVDANNITFGKLQETTGVLRVLSVEPFYTTAEVVIGGLAIDYGHYATKLDAGEAANYQGQVLTVHEDQVAISIGTSVGVQPGSYYAVFQDVKPIGEEAAFREQVGSIVVNDVYENYAKGQFTLSNHHNLSKLLVTEGAAVEEIDAPWRNAIVVGLGSYNLIDGTAISNARVSYMMPSAGSIGLAYRAHAAYGDDDWMLGAGVQTSIGYSPNFHAGIDVLYFGEEGAGANLLMSVEPPMGSNRIRPVIDLGYMVGAGAYDGLNINIGIRVNFDLW